MDSASSKFLFTTITLPTKVKRSVASFFRIFFTIMFFFLRCKEPELNLYMNMAKKKTETTIRQMDERKKGAQFTQVLVPCTKNSQIIMHTHTHRCAKHLMGDILKWMCYLKAYVNHHLNDEPSWHMWPISFQFIFHWVSWTKDQINSILVNYDQESNIYLSLNGIWMRENQKNRNGHKTDFNYLFISIVQISLQIHRRSLLCFLKHLIL